MSYTTPYPQTQPTDSTTQHQILPQASHPFEMQNQAPIAEYKAPAEPNLTGPAPAYLPNEQHANEKQVPMNPNVTQQPMPGNQGPPGNNYTNATPLGSLQQQPAPVDCPFCGVRQMSRVEYHSGTNTHLAALLCCFCFCLGCVPT